MGSVQGTNYVQLSVGEQASAKKVAEMSVQGRLAPVMEKRLGDTQDGNGAIIVFPPKDLREPSDNLSRMTSPFAFSVEPLAPTV